MKRVILRAGVVFALIGALTLAFFTTAGADTLQDRLERLLNRRSGSNSSQRLDGQTNPAQDQFQQEEPESVPTDEEVESGLRNLFSRIQSGENPKVGQEIMNIIKAFGFDVDFENLDDTDFGKIIAGFGDNTALSQLIELGQQAFSSGTSMIADVFGGGLGTAFGQNTLDNTTQAPVTSARPSTTLPAITPAPTTAPIVVEPTAAAAPATNPAQPAAIEAPAATTGAPVLSPDTAITPTTLPGQTAQVQTQWKLSQSSMIMLIAVSVVALLIIVLTVILVIRKKSV